jgi:signal transduction histidine kinase
MMASSHRKQILLFLAAVVLPSMALTFLTLQIIRQEKELAAKRLQEERSRLAREIGQVLLARLETIKRDEAQQQIRCDKTTPCAYVHPETRLMAVEKDGRLTLPWELGPATPPIAAMEPAAAALVRKAEAAEFAAKDLAKSTEAYRSALSLIASPGRKQLLRLELARVLRKSGRSQEATAIYREIAALRPDFKDEDGIPLCLYAAEALLGQGEKTQEILSLLEGIISSPGWQQPLVYYRLRDLAEYLDTIVNESERLSRLLNNVLDFSRIGEGRMVCQFAPVSVPDVVGAAAKAMSYPLEQMGFTLAIAVEDGLPEIQADRDALIQALLNLLRNAMKFSGSSRRIELSAARAEGSITMRVADHGIGIDAAEHKKIFERFYRASSSNPERIPGTGLGLTIVSHI